MLPRSGTATPIGTNRNGKLTGLRLGPVDEAGEGSADDEVVDLAEDLEAGATGPVDRGQTGVAWYALAGIAPSRRGSGWVNGAARREGWKITLRMGRPSRQDLTSRWRNGARTLET